MAQLGNLAVRVLVAVLVVPVLVLVIYQQHHVYVWGVVFLGSLVAMYEFFSMTLEDPIDRRASVFLGAVAVVAFYWIPRELFPGLLGFLLGFLPVLLYYLFRVGAVDTAASRMAYTVTGIAYAGLVFTFVALIKRDFGAAGGDLLVLLLGTAWLSDTGGYFAGRYLGKRKLYAKVSPNKTWAGAVGGVAFAGLGAAVIKLVLFPTLSWADVVLLAVPGSILGQLGDLCESLIKRSRGFKDSGQILPGHGGILDRVDALLFIAPYFYVYGVYFADWA